MILDQFRLDGQVAVVTGGNRGLGLGIAIALSEAGANIVSIQHTTEVAELASSMAHTQRELLPLAIDIGMAGAAAQALRATQEHFGRVDILVNNAGIQRRAPAVDFSLEDWDDVMNINLRAVFTFCQAFGSVMVQQGHGKIINIASLLSFQGGVTIPAYAASKHGVAGLTRALCNEWAGRGVNVNAIAPGYMDTEMNTALRANEKRNSEITARIPARRWGTFEELGGAAVFLASAASDYIHGQVLAVDGGWLSR
ncbi:MAG: 2-dehydro-3-deoxy-D-gluconate 5-dehydrogenase KduD [Ktedonobacteraceae bacterium]